MHANVTIPADEVYIVKDKNQRYELKTTAFSRSLNSYVQLKKFNQETLTYTVRKVEPTGKEVRDAVEQDLPQDDLTKEIQVLIRVVDPQSV